MTPDDWHKGMEHEADSVPDAVWAREAKWTAWRQRRGLELRQTLSWRSLSRLVIAFMLPFLLMFALPFAAFLNFLPTGNNFDIGPVCFLLLLIWAARYAWMNYAPWTLAAAASLAHLTPLLTALAVSRHQGIKFDTVPIALVVLGVVLNFTLLVAFTWAIQTLRLSGKNKGAA